MVRKAFQLACLVGVLLLFVRTSSPTAPVQDAVSRGTAPAAKLEFNRDIRPILSDKCFKCHGVDTAARKAGLRLDGREEATKPRESGGPAIVPGQPGASELVRRIFAPDDDERMPPPSSGRTLSDAERATLRKWIEQGAEYQPHWSFIVPKRPQPPASDPQRSALNAQRSEWPRNDIDRFILARLAADGLQPSPEANRETLIRRVTFDLTGLPPTIAEVDAFSADESPGAYERVVDRLLASPRFGERMALDWLDAARFADTHGYHIDSGRDMTRWRDWVIDSFNRNRPFDEFTIEQVAGDLLPEDSNPRVTLTRRIASGFNRNHMINFEGGAIPQEYHTAYIVDRVNTTGTVWLGLTVGCAQCHEHKFDPITQKEFYQLFAFFHNVPENGLDGSKGNAAPLLKVPTAEQQDRLDSLNASIKGIDSRLAAPHAEFDAAQAEWERATAAEKKLDWLVLDPVEFKSAGGATLAKLDDKSIRASGTNPATETYEIIASSSAESLDRITAIRLEALPDESFTASGPGRSVNGNIVLTDVRVSAIETPLKLKAASADFSQKDFPVSNAIDADPKSGWAIHPEVGKPHAAVFEFAEPIAVPARLSIRLDFQSQFAQHQLGRFRLSVTNSTDPHASQQLPEKIRVVLAVEVEKRNDSQRAELRDYFRASVSPAGRDLHAQLAKLRAELADFDKQIATVMVMQEMEKPRDTFMLVRGQYDKPGDKVTPGVPAVFPSLPADSPTNRLGLARWLVSPDQPLTARVIVNRYWQMFFGTGLVKTAEDFGSQGEWPSHPELLDWLACEFVEGSRQLAVGSRELDSQRSTPNAQRSAWDIKHIVRLIVTSAAYRQSSVVTPGLVARDPENRLMARGPRYRLQAEFIRDQALAVSGLLNDQIGGKSVSPYQPAGLWEELMSREDGKNWTAQSYTQDHGPDLYRRTMYTFWKRTCPPPTLATFDAPDRETCTVRRPRTNTPLQALILMNDPTYIEASRKLAERLLTEANSTDNRLELAFRLATARRPRPHELAALSRVLDAQLATYRRDPAAALKLLAVGESPRDEQLDPAELAAWTIVANVILNLDETVTKG